MKRSKNRPAGMDLKLVLRYPAPAIFAMIILTICAGYGIKHLKIAADPLASMYPAGHAYISTLNAIKAMTPEARLLVCILKVEQGDIYTSETLNKIDAITKGLLSIDGIMPGSITALTRGMMHYYNSVMGLNIESVMGTMWPKTPEEFEALKRRVATNPMGLGRYVSYDQTAVMITAKLSDIVKRSRHAYEALPKENRPSFDAFTKHQTAQFNASVVKALDALKKSQDDPNHTIYFMGQEVLTDQMTQMGTVHIVIAAGVMAGTVLLLLSLYFRTIGGVITPLVAMGVTVIWALGLYGWAGIELNPLMILFPLVLSFLSLALSTMLTGEYGKALLETVDKLQAIDLVFSRLSLRRVILIAGMVISSMAIAPVPALKALAAMGFFWMIGAYVAIVLLSPVLLMLMSAPSPTGRAKSFFPDRFSNLNGTATYTGFILGLVILIGGGFCYTRLQVGDNIPGTSYIRKSHPWNQCFNLFAEKFMGPQQLLVYVKADTQGGLVEPQAMNAIRDFSSFLVNDCGAKDSIAFDMMIRMCRWTLMDGNPKWQVLPLSRDKLEGLAGTVFEQGGVEDFIDRSFTQGTISPFFPERDTTSIDLYAEKMQNYIETHPTPGIKFSIGGGLLGMTKPQNDATRLAYPRILLMVAITILISGIMFLSPVKEVAVTFSIFCAQAFVWLSMIVLGVHLSLAVISVTSASIAIGLILGSALFNENTIHTALFAGGLVFAASVPFFLIGMRFQANMLLLFGLFSAAEIVMGVLVMPVFREGKKTSWKVNLSTRQSETKRRFV